MPRWVGKEKVEHALDILERIVENGEADSWEEAMHKLKQTIEREREDEDKPWAKPT